MKNDTENILEALKCWLFYFNHGLNVCGVRN